MLLLHVFYVHLGSVSFNVKFSYLVNRMEAVAQSTTPSEYEHNLLELQASDEYRSDCAVQTWFENKWVPHSEVRFLSTLQLY